jgi:hypothetical protein
MHKEFSVFSEFYLKALSVKVEFSAFSECFAREC